MFTSDEITTLKILREQIEQEEPSRGDGWHTMKFSANQLKVLYKALDSVIDVFEDDVAPTEARCVLCEKVISYNEKEKTDYDTILLKDGTRVGFMSEGDSVCDECVENEEAEAQKIERIADALESEQRIERMLEKQDAERGADDYEPSED